MKKPILVKLTGNVPDDSSAILTGIKDTLLDDGPEAMAETISETLLYYGTLYASTLCGVAYFTGVSEEAVRGMFEGLAKDTLTNLSGVKSQKGY